MRGKFSWLLATTVIVAAAFLPRALVRAQAPTWQNVTGNLANMQSECGNLTLLSVVPSTGAVIAGVAQRGLWISNSGSTWTHLGDGAGSDVITNRPSWIVHDPAHPGTFWESGIYNGGGVYKTTDGGNTFKRLGDITHNDYVSVDLTDPARQTLLAGPHEQTQRVHKSTNGGTNWSNAGATIPAGTKFSTEPLVINAQTYLVNSQGYISGTQGIYRTINGGASWTQVSTGGAVLPPLVTANGTIYWNAGGSLLKSTNQGETWTSVGNGLHQVRPIQLPDGRLASFSNNSIVISANEGVTWTPITPGLPYNNAAGLVYSPQRQAFFVWRWDCGNVVPANGIQMLSYPVAGPGPVPTPPANLRVVVSEH
jgi:photosystem II stability/assembly factor-like uncharacterized protein